MSRVYGRIQAQDTHQPVQGDILFEPKNLGYVVDNVLYATFVYRCKLDDAGRFEVDVAPGIYTLYIENARFEINVPAVNEVSLKELLRVRYRT